MQWIDVVAARHDNPRHPSSGRASRTAAFAPPWRDRRRTMNAARGLLALGSVLVAACGSDLKPTAPASRLAAGDTAALDSRSATTSGTAAIYVVHGINGTDIGAAEALPVDVVVNGGCALRGLTFRQIAGPLSLPAGSYNIEVRLANAAAPCTGPVAISAAGVPVTARANASIVAHLSSSGAPTASVFSNETTTRHGRARLTARHTAAFGAVDILVDRRVAFAGVTNGQQGSAELRPGRHLVAINPAGASTSAWQATLKLRPFTTYIAYAVGTPAKHTFEVILQTLSPKNGMESDDADDDDRDRA